MPTSPIIRRFQRTVMACSFRESDLLRKLFETGGGALHEGRDRGRRSLRGRRQPDCCRCASTARRRQGRRPRSDLKPRGRAEYLSVLDDAAFGGATPVEPKAISADRSSGSSYTAAADTPAFYAYSDNYLIDLKHAVIMDVEATTAIRQAEVGAAKTMLDRTAEQFEVAPSRLVVDAGLRLGRR